MADEISLFAGAAERLARAAQTHPELRLALREFAGALMALVEGQSAEAGAATPLPGIDEQPAPVHVPAAAIAREPVSADDRPASKNELMEMLRQSVASLQASVQSAPVPPPVVASPEPMVTAELHRIEARCQLKAEGARWAAGRRRLFRAGADRETEVDPGDRDLIARARALPNCFLWLNGPGAPEPTDLGAYEIVAGCFACLADAAGLVWRVAENSESLAADFELSLDLLAEAQSALRVAATELDHIDSDQMAAYEWLRTATREQGVYVSRHMRLNDPASPERWPDLAARIAAAAGKGDSRREIRELFEQAATASSRLQSGASGSAAWAKLADVTGRLFAMGIPASNVELREIFLPLVELADDGDPAEPTARMFGEIDRFLANRPAPPVESEARSLAPEVRQVADLLEGRAIVVMGGDRRRDAENALVRDLRLANLYWIETREHGSFTVAERDIARPDVAVVLLAIRWASHGYSDIQRFCDAYDKPLVRLPAGYSPNQVAVQILAQASARLAVTAPRSGGPARA